MSKKAIFAVILLFSVVLAGVQFTGSTKASRTWAVDDNGLADFRTVQGAVDAAGSGDTVLVHSGTYYEHVVVNKSIKLIGISPFDTVVDAGQEASASVIMIEANDVIVRNLTLRNSVGSHSWDVGGGVYLYHSSGCSIENCIALGNPIGINLYGSSDNNVSHNLARGNSRWGIKVGCSDGGSSDNNLITENWVDGMSIGWFASNNTIAENHVFGSAFLFILSPASGVVCHNNFVGDAPFSINAQMSGLNFTWSKDGEGNFYKYYAGVDANGDGVGDTPYVIQYLSWNLTQPTYGTTSDEYPLMKPHGWLEGDVNYDTVVNILDLFAIARAFGSNIGGAGWNARCDLNNDRTVSILDITLAASNFSKEMEWLPS